MQNRERTRLSLVTHCSTPAAYPRDDRAPGRVPVRYCHNGGITYGSPIQPELENALATAGKMAPQLGSWVASLSWQVPLRLYNDAWKNNWGSIPVSNAEARLIADLTLPVAKPSWIRIAQWRGEDIAVVSQIPDVNEALVGLGGKLWPSGWARLLWRIHGRGTRMTRIPMIGIASRNPVENMAEPKCWTASSAFAPGMKLPGG